MENRFETFTVLISSINRSIRRIKTEEMSEYGLKSPHVSCLYYLYKKPSITAAELCEVCEEDKAAVSRSILFLEQNGFLLRVANGTETAREGGKYYRAPLILTEKGRATAERLSISVDRVLADVSAGVSNEDRATMYRVLEQINRNLREVCDQYEN